jgi:hypothetical protein
MRLYNDFTRFAETHPRLIDGLACVGIILYCLYLVGSHTVEF